MFDPARYEELLRAFYSTLLRDGDIAVDVGAHSGLHTLPLARCVGPRGHVFAFEPLPGFAESLRATLDQAGLAGRVTISGQAVSDVAGESTFQIAVDRPQESGIRERNRFNGPTRIETIHVVLGRLDDLVPESAVVRFVKIDVEGAEFSVLRGAERMLSTHRPVVAFEFGMNSAEAYNVDPRALYAYLADRRYVVADIRGNRLDAEGFASSARVQEVWDYVAFPAELDAQPLLQGLALEFARPAAPDSASEERRRAPGFWRRLLRRIGTG